MMREDHFFEIFEPPAADALAPRLFSRGFEADQSVVVFDHVEPKHAAIHALLVRWGTWARARAQRRGGGTTVESLYERGGDGTPPSTAPNGPDPELVRVERAMLRMPRERAGVRGLRWISEGRARLRVADVHESPGLTLRLLYAQRWQPLTICAMLVPHLRPVAWAAHVGIQRAMAQNVFRSLG
jgi:hypothetical protein